jgi:hypothetical protein
VFLSVNIFGWNKYIVEILGMNVRLNIIFYVCALINRFGTTTNWELGSILVFKHPYSVPYLPAKWWSNFVKSALHVNHEFAHLYGYYGVFSDTVTDWKKENPQLPPSNWSRSWWQGYLMRKVDATFLTGYLIIDDNPLRSLIYFSLGMNIASDFF